MSRFVKKTSQKAGLSPGALVHTGEQKMEKATISIIGYDRENLIEKKLLSVEETYQHRDSPPVTWININGLHDVGMIEKVGQHFDIHPLTLEDIVSTGQRPKVEDFESYLFVVLKMLTFDAAAAHISSEQISLILGEHYLLSFQEHTGDVFDSVRQRIRQAKGRIRNAGCDYLAYALTDAVVDHYFVVLEKLGEKIESLRDVLSGLHDLYLSTISNRMNEVMKVLTIMATIFIPLTFIAGIYGMNFEFMPELKWKWSYPLLWAVLIAIFAFLLFWFKRKKWL